MHHHPSPFISTHLHDRSTSDQLSFPLMTILGLDTGATMNNIIELHTNQTTQPSSVNGNVSPPRRKKNTEVRSREYLTSQEVDALIKAAGNVGRHKHRDKTLILVMHRHGLRVSEAVSLRWDMVDLKEGLLHVTRVKNGTPSTHPLRGVELRALRRLKSDYPDTPYVFVTERKSSLTTSTVRKLVARAGVRAGLELSTHPHMLRHSTGFYLANKGHDTRSIQHYLGHKNINHTVRYTELASDRFNDFWND